MRISEIRMEPPSRLTREGAKYRTPKSPDFAGTNGSSRIQARRDGQESGTFTLRSNTESQRLGRSNNPIDRLNKGAQLDIVKVLADAQIIRLRGVVTAPHYTLTTKTFLGLEASRDSTGDYEDGITQDELV